VRLIAAGLVRFDPANPRRVMIDRAGAGESPAARGAAASAIEGAR
jgi:hypothetical protein